MKYTKHSKPIQRNPSAGDPEEPQMAMNRMRTKSIYESREIVQEDETDQPKDNRSKLDAIQSDLKMIRPTFNPRYRNEQTG